MTASEKISDACGDRDSDTVVVGMASDDRVTTLLGVTARTLLERLAPRR